MRETALSRGASGGRGTSPPQVPGPAARDPYGVKDLVGHEGRADHLGRDRPNKDQRFDYDATVVERLRAAGAVLCAKLAMVELGGRHGVNHADASFTGRGSRPGTPSSGAAAPRRPGAAVASGLVPFAIGSETWVDPDAVGLFRGDRAPADLRSGEPGTGAMGLCWTLDKLGPMARSARRLRPSCWRDRGPSTGWTRAPAAMGFTYERRAVPGSKPLPRRVPKGVVRKRCSPKSAPTPRVDRDPEGTDRGDPRRRVARPAVRPAVSAIVGAKGRAHFLDLIETGA